MRKISAEFVAKYERKHQSPQTAKEIDRVHSWECLDRFGTGNNSGVTPIWVAGGIGFCAVCQV